MSDTRKQIEINSLLAQAKALEGMFRLHDYCANDIRESWLEQAKSHRAKAERLKKELKVNA